MVQRILAWFTARSPRAQLGYGCLASGIVATLLLYCLGLTSLVARPFLLVEQLTPNLPLTTPTQANITNRATASPVPSVVITVTLPKTTLIATPTQAPIPTRAPTDTPTATASPSPTLSGTPPTPNPSATTTSTSTRTNVPNPAATNTRTPTRTPTSTTPVARP